MPKQPKRLRLKGWLEGESLREKIRESKSTGEIVEHLYSYLTLIYEESKWEKLNWIEISELTYAGATANLPTKDFPLTKPSGKPQAKPLPWEYNDRSWYMWANMFGSAYGWTLEYIAEIDIDDAIGLMQELLVEEQLKKEWEWNLSEITYSYDTQTKRTKHPEYPRPNWMISEPEPVKVTKIPKSMIPVGLVIKDEHGLKYQ